MHSLSKTEKIRLSIGLMLIGIIYVGLLLAIRLLGINLIPKNIGMICLYGLGLGIINIYFAEDYFVRYLMKQRRNS